MPQTEHLALEPFSQQAQTILGDALVLAEERYASGFLGVEHLLIAMLEVQESHGYRILQSLPGDMGGLSKRLEERLQAPHETERMQIQIGLYMRPLSRELHPLLLLSSALQKRFGTSTIGTDLILYALAESAAFRPLFAQAGFNIRQIHQMIEQKHSAGQAAEEADISILGVAELAAMATEAPYVLHQSPLETLMSSLLDQRSRGVLLVGEPDAGAWGQVIGLAQLLMNLASRAPFGLIAIHPDYYLANAALAMQAAVRRCRNTASMLVVPDLSGWLVSDRNDYINGGDILRQAVLNQGVKIIGIVTPETELLIQRDPLFSQLLRVRIEPATQAQTATALTQLAEKMAGRTGITIQNDVLLRFLGLTDRYLPGVLPGKAFRFLSEVFAEALRRQLLQPGFTGQIDDALGLQVIERQTGIPLSQVLSGERERLARMEEIIHERYIGQSYAVRSLAQSVRRGRTAFRDPNRPIGSFMFLGPTGVGKTELAKALAAFLFGTEEALIEISMTEFGERHTVSVLLGSPPGYEAHGARTRFDEVREKPFAVVLFDELEKGHNDVILAVMQAVENGKLTDRAGRVIDFRHTIIIMTTNVGTPHLIGVDPQAEQVRAIEAVQQAFKPEFLNRIDEIIPFFPFTQEDLVGILRLMLGKTIQEAAEEQVQLEVEDSDLHQVIEGMLPLCQRYGARAVRRAVDAFERLLADLVMAGKLAPGAIIDLAYENARIQPVIKDDRKESKE